MKLVTKELEQRFQKVGRQEEVKDPIVVAKFFSPIGPATWFATEIEEYRLNKGEDYITANNYDEKEKLVEKGYVVNDIIFFGYASLFGDHNDEWGSFSLTELEELELPFGMHIERDMYCGEKPISKFNIQSLKQ